MGFAVEIQSGGQLEVLLCLCQRVHSKIELEVCLGRDALACEYMSVIVVGRYLGYFSVRQDDEVAACKAKCKHDQEEDDTISSLSIEKQVASTYSPFVPDSTSLESTRARVSDDTPAHCQ